VHVRVFMTYVTEFRRVRVDQIATFNCNPGPGGHYVTLLSHQKQFTVDPDRIDGLNDRLNRWLDSTSTQPVH